MKQTNNFTLVEIIAVLLIIAIMAAVAAPRFINFADDAREGIAQAGNNEAKASLSVAYAKAYLDNYAPGGSGGAPTNQDVLDAADFGASETFGDVTVAFATTEAGKIGLTATYDGKTATDTWIIPSN